VDLRVGLDDMEKRKFLTLPALKLRSLVRPARSTNYKPLISFMSDFALPYAGNMIILMILCDSCLLPAQFCYTTVYIWKMKTRVQVADQYAPWIISNGEEELFFSGAAILRSGCLYRIPRLSIGRSVS
jgi:hypothetical protein